jgi:hypothetical protein
MGQFSPGMQHCSKIYLFLAVILIQGLNVQGQSPVFGVYFTAGNIKYVPARGGARSLDLHTWLNASDKLILLDNIAETTLFARDTCYIRLHGKGTYTTAEIENMPRTRIRDTLISRYLSLLWAEVIRPAPVTKNHIPGLPVHSPSIIIAPRETYATSMDSLVFRWHSASWARKYFLRLRSPNGQLCYDSVLIDTQAVVHFPGRMSAGNSYTWGLDIIAESGRLQFVDSSRILLVDESAVLPRLPPVVADSIGGIAILLQRIEQYENAGCIKQAEALFFQLTNDYPQDAALDKLYASFRRRNYF